MRRRSHILIFIVILTPIQRAPGVFQVFERYNIGADQLGQRLLILPLVGAVVFARGESVTLLTLPHGLFALGMLVQKRWARWPGPIAAAAGVLVVRNVVMQDESLSRALFSQIASVLIATRIQSFRGRAATV